MLFFILEKQMMLTKVVYFSKIHYHTSFQDPLLSVTNVASTIQVHVSTMLLLLIVRLGLAPVVLCS
jgi:hypothetical protein